MLLIVKRIGAQSPIIIDKNNFTMVAGVYHFAIVNPKMVADPKTGKSISWDYTLLKPDSIIKQNFISCTRNPFSRSAMSLGDPGKQEFLTSDNNFSEDGFYDEDRKGFFFAGDYVKAQYFSLKDYFNDSSDNISIPEQDDSVRINMMSFPTTFGSSHHSSVTKSLRFLWTVNSAGLHDAPSIKKTDYNIIDTVTGWGTMRVPDSGSRSIAYPVLQIRRRTVTIDSYYVNNQAASKYFLIAFGIVQGKKTIDCEEYFYKSGHQEPLLTIGYGSDTTYTVPIGLLYTTDSIKKQAAVEIENPDIHNFTLFPNPANGSQVKCSFTKENSEPWQILIFNSTGQVFKSETIESKGKINMTLDISGAKSGLYFTEVFDEKGMPIATGRLSIIH